MYYLTKSGWITSDEELEKKPYLHKIGNSIGEYTIDDCAFETLDYIVKQSENVFDLIDRENDLIKIELLGGYFNIVGVKTLNGNWKENDRISAIYKPNKNGDYIKVWEKESEQ